MNEALRLAELARGDVEPNPVVGAVLARDGQIIACGYHHKFGSPHAEIEALNTAGEAARGATLYVTLEPCSHFGKTPPCTLAIERAGVRRVVVAMVDPFPAVNGSGLEYLRHAGIAVDVGCQVAHARAVNAPFIKFTRTGRPFVIAKWAQSLDGAVATAAGESQWISGPEARERVQVLRGRMDAIMVGIGTALADNPQLTARPRDSQAVRRVAKRVVVDTQARLPVESALVKSAREFPLLLAHAPATDDPARERLSRLRAAGAVLLEIAADSAGQVALNRLLAALGRQGIQNLLVEGGPKLLGSLMAVGEVDECQVYLAPMIMADPAARHALHGPPLTHLADAHRWRWVCDEPVGSDRLLVLRKPEAR